MHSGALYKTLFLFTTLLLTTFVFTTHVVSAQSCSDPNSSPWAYDTCVNEQCVLRFYCSDSSNPDLPEDSCSTDAQCESGGSDGGNEEEEHDYTLNITKSGSGTGLVTSSGIYCGSDCSDTDTTENSHVLEYMHANPDADSTFVEWSVPEEVIEHEHKGECTRWVLFFCVEREPSTYTYTYYCGSHLNCRVYNFGTRTVDARFKSDITKEELHVYVFGNGSGWVRSIPDGIDLYTSITTGNGYTHHAFNTGERVTLTAYPDPGSEFTGWGSCPNPSGNLCTVTMNSVEHVHATFEKKEQYTLTLKVVNETPGTPLLDVQDTARGISMCQLRVEGSGTDTQVCTLAETGKEYRIRPYFFGTSLDSFEWDGACSGTNFSGCSIVLNSDKTVVARFENDPTVEVTLHANPSSGMGPLTVDLTTTVSGTATGPKTFSNHSCGSGGSLLSKSGGSFTCRYDSAGSKSASITVTQEGVSDSDSASISVTAPPEPEVLSFKADPNWIAKGDDTTLYWEVTNATSCTLSTSGTSFSSETYAAPASTHSGSYNGSYTHNIQEATAYELSCENAIGETKTAEAIVYVLPTYTEF